MHTYKEYNNKQSQRIHRETKRMRFQPGQRFVCLFNSHRSEISHQTGIFNLIHDEGEDGHNRLELSAEMCQLLLSNTRHKELIFYLHFNGKPKQKRKYGRAFFLSTFPQAVALFPAIVSCAFLCAIYTDDVMVLATSSTLHITLDWRGTALGKMLGVEESAQTSV